ncbi:competence protein ComEA [Microbacteriaceae bacterium SG_E_30_P1]|uniref:Competence protein ComEA n=1 Tax=Antiquaquibacter oligotrophicus TaxID=2880260 RepID=A0ABT6KN35_9MICO|nr:ComEA family DNA-binding protein [Antiquaquibacter oligotrophicus]MDH6181165.1 competence protein ComEA [Antiquaquibacter oligotrophicus]UDF13139.1 ComEA family DNA-binding protein [Antiquaquibacter oligotrophicus]
MDAPPVEPRTRFRVGVGAVVVLVLVGLGCAILLSTLLPRSSTSSTIAPAPTGQYDETTGVAILVHVLGAVSTPGLYELREGDRVVDAVTLAGGFTADADQGGVNLARPVSDGEQLVVPRVGEVAADAPAGDGKVNLNTADAAALDTLPRVGPAMAERIIAWRDANGGFRAIEDLLNVSGIGDATFAGMKDLVSV